jgi:hypothetical protein
MKALTIALVTAGLSTAALADSPVTRNPTAQADQDAQARFESLDRNNDLQLSKVEARADVSIGTRFASVDASGDGNLTELEYATSRRMQDRTRPEPIER